MPVAEEEDDDEGGEPRLAAEGREEPTPLKESEEGEKAEVEEIDGDGRVFVVDVPLDPIEE